ncbi:MAG: hypothetical protein NZ653_01305 [Anaerolineae bacterium]|nr:hypothetical protein [Anaerolineae bacterium]
MPFILFLLWSWRVQNIFTHLPAYEDVLEVLWGIRWYHETIFVRHIPPWFTPFVFHPLGWHTTTLAHTPFLFILALPLYELGGEAFAYNILAMISLAFSFSGALRFARLFTPKFPALIIAIVFTFSSMHFSRVKGHMHMLWGFSLLPWLALAIEKLKRVSSPQAERTLTIIIGLIWGLMVNFVLYGIFMGAMVFALWGSQIFQLKRLKQAFITAIIACLVASPVLVLQIIGRWQDNTLFFGLDHNVYWGASLNSLFIPSAYHPLPLIQKFARSLYRGPYSETETPSLGLITFILALAGIVVLLRNKTLPGSPLTLAVVGLILGLGPLLKWDGEVIQASFFRPLNTLIWRLGHVLKPGIFRSSQPDLPFDSGFPLPGFLLTALVPFWEVGRVASRYTFVGGLGVITLAGLALRSFPKGLRYVIAILWLIETLPYPTSELPLHFNLHPAYVWITGQTLEPGEGIADLAFPTLTLRPENLWATLLHQKPTASGLGSSLPEHFFALWAHLLQNEDALARPDIGLLLQQYRIRYLLVHFVHGGKEEAMWRLINTNPVFIPIGCFAPVEEISPWSYKICVAKVKDMEDPMNLVRLDGWSGKEEWGIWAEGLLSKAQWLAPKREDYVLKLKAFPFCVPEKQQTMAIRINGQEIALHKWEDCKLWEGTILLPRSKIRRGWNELTFEYAYALKPSEIAEMKGGDERALSVGFLEARVYQWEGRKNEP